MHLCQLSFVNHIGLMYEKLQSSYNVQGNCYGNVIAKLLS